MLDMMIDIESMGTDSDAAIVQIGAVVFCPREGFICDEPPFLVNIDLDTCLKHGLTVSGSTIMWWLSQSQEARDSLTNPEPISIDSALFKLSEWTELAHQLPGGGQDSIKKVWAHANFDAPIIDSAYKKIMPNFMQIPWKYRDFRDLRTLIDIVYPDDFNTYKKEMETAIPSNSSKHNAVADAKHQARQVIFLYEKLKERYGQVS